MTIAINKFQANNCPKSLARATEELLAAEIYNSNLFILLERSQMEVVFNKMKFKEKQTVDIKYATQLGKILSVEKVFIGSISKLDDYIVEIRVVNVNNSRVDIVATENFKKVSDLEKSIQKIFKSIFNFYTSQEGLARKFSMSLAPSYQNPHGHFSKGLTKGYGFNFILNVDNLFVKNDYVGLLIGFIDFKPEIDSIDKFYMFPIQFLLGYSLILSENIYISPIIGAGYIIGWQKYDPVENRTDNSYEYQTENYYNPLVSIKAELNFKASQHMSFIVSPFYLWFFEKDYTGKILGADFGIKFIF